MATVFLDEVFKPFFKNRPWHGPTTDDRSDEFPDGRLPSSHSTYGVCECKHAISNTPKRKNHTLEDRESEGATARLRNGEMRCPGNMFRTMVIDSFAVCAVAPSCWKWPTQRKRMPTTLFPPRPTYWVLPIQKMSVSRGSPCIYTYSFFILCTQFHVAYAQTTVCRSCPHHIEG